MIASIKAVFRYARSNTMLPWAVLGVGLLASFLLFTEIKENVEHAAVERFEHQTTEAKRVIETRILSYADVLYSVRAQFAVRAQVSLVDFQRFVQSLDLGNRFPGFEVVNYATYVRAEDQRRFLEGMRRDTSLEPRGHAPFVIKPPGERPEYHVLVYLEPMAGNEFALGLDVGANPASSDPGAVAAALRSARDSGQLTASGGLIRVKRAKEFVGLAMRLPVYRSGLLVETVEQRRAAYVGSRSTHLTETLNLDPAPFSPTGTKGALRLNTIVASLGITPSNLFSQVQQDSQDINSTYHSLQLSAEKRMTHGLTILGSYTWSKSIDDLPAGAGVTGFDTFSARPWDDPLRHQFDRGPSDFDHTHRFVSSFVWELPGFSGSRGFLHHAFGGWQYSGLVAAQTGRPFTVLQGAELSGTGLGQDRGTLLAGVSPYGNAQCGTTPACVSWLNKAAFATTAATVGTYGRTGKNAFRMPGKYNWDMGLSKNFTFTERWRLQFRAEFFNVFNRVNFFDEEVASGAGTQPSITNFQRLSAGAFGTFRAGQVGDPRIGQLALKVFF